MAPGRGVAATGAEGWEGGREAETAAGALAAGVTATAAVARVRAAAATEAAVMETAEAVPPATLGTPRAVDINTANTARRSITQYEKAEKGLYLSDERDACAFLPTVPFRPQLYSIRSMSERSDSRRPDNQHHETWTIRTCVRACQLLTRQSEATVRQEPRPKTKCLNICGAVNLQGWPTFASRSRTITRA